MITFNELSFSDDMQSLAIECSVDLTENPNAHIKRVYLEYFENRNAIGAPSSKSLLLFSDEDEPSPVTYVELEVNQTQLSKKDIGVDSFAGGLFYVLVHWEDEGEKEYYGIGAVLDWKYVYELGMHYISKFALRCFKDRCELPEDFEQLVIVTHALEFAIQAKDLDQLDLLWGRFILFAPGIVSQCNCR